MNTTLVIQHNNTIKLQKLKISKPQFVAVCYINNLQGVFKEVNYPTKKKLFQIFLHYNFQWL
jgi:hypothetical protein